MVVQPSAWCLQFRSRPSPGSAAFGLSVAHITPSWAAQAGMGSQVWFTRMQSQWCGLEW